MIDMIYVANSDTRYPQAIEKQTTTLEQGGIIHSKVAGRFEVVKVLPQVADSFDNMFNYADAFGNIRMAYIDSAHKISSNPNKEEKKASAIGGFFGLNTAQYNGVNFHISAFVSESLNFVNPHKDKLNQDFFTPQNESFSYIGEASINYSNSLLQTNLGRLRIETPYANSDDIRMAPNTFEGVWSNIDYTDKFKTQLLYLKSWAGYDSQDEDSNASQSEFKSLVGDDSFGMLGASFTYEYAKNSEVSFWYNYIDDMAAISYAEIVGIYFMGSEYVHLDYGLQASHIKELSNSGVDGNVLGALAIMHYNGLFLGGAYNISLSDVGKNVTNGFGGGPYYTSLDEATISAVSESRAEYQNINTAESFRIATGYEFENISIDGLVVELVYGEIFNDKGSIFESDVIISYEITDKWYAEATYTHYKSTCHNNTFDRTLVRLDYAF